MAFCFLASSNLLCSGSLHFLPHQRNSEMIWLLTNQEQNRKSWNLNTFHLPTDLEVSQWLCCALGGPSLHWGRVMKPLRYLGIDRRFQRRLHVKPFPASQNRWLGVTSFPVTPDIIIWIKFTSCLNIYSMRGSPLKTYLLFLHVLSCVIFGLTDPMKLWDSPLQFSKQMWCQGIVPLSMWQGWEWECFSPKGVVPSRPLWSRLAPTNHANNGTPHPFTKPLRLEISGAVRDWWAVFWWFNLKNVEIQTYCLIQLINQLPSTSLRTSQLYWETKLLNAAGAEHSVKPEKQKLLHPLLNRSLGNATLRKVGKVHAVRFLPAWFCFDNIKIVQFKRIDVKKR